LLLVPVFYAICVLDLKIVKWDRTVSTDMPAPETQIDAGAVTSAATQLG
jgi:hypothetical protein